MIHRYWTGPNTPPESSNMAKAIAVNSLRMQLKDWTDTTLPPDIVAAADATMGYVPDDQALRHRSNVIRLHLLHRFGGIYMDHDFVLLKQPGQNEIAAHPDGTVCSCYMAFDDGHPLIAEAIAGIAPRPLSRLSSGSTLLNRVFDDTVTRLPLPCSHLGTGISGIPKVVWGIHLSLTTEV